MIVRVYIAAILAAICLVGCASSEARHTWDPAMATAEAERDIAAGHIRFCFVGDYAFCSQGAPLAIPTAPGLPYHASPDITRRYPRFVIPEDGREYAQRYNMRMLRYLRSKHT